MLGTPRSKFAGGGTREVGRVTNNNKQSKKMYVTAFGFKEAKVT